MSKLHAHTTGDYQRSLCGLRSKGQKFTPHWGWFRPRVKYDNSWKPKRSDLCSKCRHIIRFASEGK